MRRLADWRLAFSLGFVGLVAVAAFYMSDAIRARTEAVRVAEETIAAQMDLRQAATRRIDLLNEQVGELSDRLSEANRSVAALEGQVSGLRRQVVGLGGDPVVVHDTERVVVKEPAGGSDDGGGSEGSGGAASASSAEGPEDPCENRNPQGKCTDADPKGK